MLECDCALWQEKHLLVHQEVNFPGGRAASLTYPINDGCLTERAHTNNGRKGQSCGLTFLSGNPNPFQSPTVLFKSCWGETQQHISMKILSSLAQDDENEAFTYLSVGVHIDWYEGLKKH